MFCIGCPDAVLQQEVVVLEVSGCSRRLVNHIHGGAVGEAEAGLSAHDAAPRYGTR